jgi:hypothetical protein
LNESRYWAALEYRICREFAGMAADHLRYLWCDGLIPERYDLDGPAPCIRGRAWVCNGPRQEPWEFTLYLPAAVGSRERIDWPALLPPEGVTRWLALDRRARRIEFEPAAAAPDPA